MRQLKDYVILAIQLYRGLLGGILAQCVGEKEAYELMKEMYNATCDVKPVVALHRRLQRKGYFWPSMKKQANELQSLFPQCRLSLPQDKVFTTKLSKGWRAPYINFLINGVLPDNLRKLKRIAKRFFMEGSILFQRSFNEEPLRCLNKEEALKVMIEVHAGEYGEH